MTNFKIEWYKIKNRKEKEVKIELSNFYCEDKKAQYQAEIKNNMEKIEQQNTAQDKKDCNLHSMQRSRRESPRNQEEGCRQERRKSPRTKYRNKENQQGN